MKLSFKAYTKPPATQAGYGGVQNCLLGDKEAENGDGRLRISQ